MKKLRIEWDDHINFLKPIKSKLEGWELGILKSCIALRDKNKDISRKQSTWLRKISNKYQKGIFYE